MAFFWQKDASSPGGNPETQFSPPTETPQSLALQERQREAAQGQELDSLVKVIYLSQTRAVSEWIDNRVGAPPQAPNDADIRTQIAEAVAIMQTGNQPDLHAFPLLQEAHISSLLKIAGIRPVEESARVLPKDTRRSMENIIANTAPIPPEGLDANAWVNRELTLLKADIVELNANSTPEATSLTMGILDDWSRRPPGFALTPQILSGASAPPGREHMAANARYLAIVIIRNIDLAREGEIDVQDTVREEKDILNQKLRALAEGVERARRESSELAQSTDRRQKELVYSLCQTVFNGGASPQFMPLENFQTRTVADIKRVLDNLERFRDDIQNQVNEFPAEITKFQVLADPVRAQLATPEISSPRSLKNAIDKYSLENTLKQYEFLITFMGDTDDPISGTLIFALQDAQKQLSPEKFDNLSEISRSLPDDIEAIKINVTALDRNFTTLRTIVAQFSIAKADLEDLIRGIASRSQVTDFTDRQRIRKQTDIPNTITITRQNLSGLIGGLASNLSNDQMANLWRLLQPNIPDPGAFTDTVNRIDIAILRATQDISKSQALEEAKAEAKAREQKAEVEKAEKEARKASRTSLRGALADAAKAFGTNQLAKAAEISDRLGRPRVVVSGERTSDQRDLFVVPDRNLRDNFETTDDAEITALLERFNTAWRQKGELPPLDYVDLVIRLIDSGRSVVESYQRLALRVALIGNHNINEVIRAMSTNPEDIASVMRDLLLHPTRPLDIRVIIDIYNSTGNRVWLAELYAQLQEEAREPLEPRRSQASAALTALDARLPFTITHPTSIPMPTRYIPPLGSLPPINELDDLAAVALPGVASVPFRRKPDTNAPPNYSVLDDPFDWKPDGAPKRPSPLPPDPAVDIQKSPRVLLDLEAGLRSYETNGTLYTNDQIDQVLQMCTDRNPPSLEIHALAYRSSLIQHYRENEFYWTGRLTIDIATSIALECLLEHIMDDASVELVWKDIQYYDIGYELRNLLEKLSITAGDPNQARAIELLVIFHDIEVQDFVDAKGKDVQKSPAEVGAEKFQAMLESGKTLFRDDVKFALSYIEHNSISASDYIRLLDNTLSMGDYFDVERLMYLILHDLKTKHQNGEYLSAVQMINNHSNLPTHLTHILMDISRGNLGIEGFDIVKFSSSRNYADVWRVFLIVRDIAPEIGNLITDENLRKMMNILGSQGNETIVLEIYRMSEKASVFAERMKPILKEMIEKETDTNHKINLQKWLDNI